MKFGLRKPSIKKSIGARTTGKLKRKLKKNFNPFYGKKGVGFATDPKRSIKNKIYRKTTFSIRDLFKRTPKSESNVQSQKGTSPMLNRFKKILLWIVAALFIVLAFNFGISTIFALLTAAVIAPIEPLQKVLRRLLSRWERIGLIVILILCTLVLFPKAPQNKQPEDQSIASGQNNSETDPAGNDDQKPNDTNKPSSHTHDFTAATCTTPKTCKICKKIEGEIGTHQWKEATCSAPKTCKVCNKTEGEIGAHQWKEATCSTPKTCKVCGETNGKAIGHKWNIATCKTPKICSACSITEGGKGDHSYSNGYCSVCNTEDPSYVWIPNSGGTKYHSRSNCSSMKNPSFVPESKAIAKGYSPCSKCH